MATEYTIQVETLDYDDDWRVWLGHDADPETQPVYNAGWNYYEP